VAVLCIKAESLRLLALQVMFPLDEFEVAL